MNSKPSTPITAAATPTETSSGWDPFTVWRERVHKPRLKSAERSTVAAKLDGDVAVLRPIAERG